MENIVSTIKDVVVTIASAGGIFVAITGLSAWRKQLTGKNEYEVGIRVLRSTYKIRDAIAALRNPLITAGEQAAAIEWHSKNASHPAASSDEQRKDEFIIYSYRWNGISAALQDFDLLRIEAEVLWGAFITERMMELRKSIITLRLSLENHLYDRYESMPGRYKEIQDTIFSIGSMEDNNYSQELQKIVDSIENFIRRKLK